MLGGTVLRQEAVVFKGTKEGIHIYLDDRSDFPTLVTSLHNRLASSPGFFRGARVVINAGNRLLSASEVEEVRRVLSQYDDVQLVRLEQRKDFREKRPKELPALVLQGPIRSGRQVVHEGHVTIVGDVNPGAELIAVGSIVVLGTLRGSAHAGSRGNRESFIAATLFDPAQLSIAGIWARRPDGEIAEPSRTIPEVAKLRQGRIIIEAYQQHGSY